MSWNYRVVRAIRLKDTDPYWYGISEVYYHDDGTIRAWSTPDLGPHGEDLAELESDLEHIGSALNLPILEESTRPDGRACLIEIPRDKE